MRLGPLEACALGVLAGLGSVLGCAPDVSQCESFDRVESEIKFEFPDAGIEPVPASRAIFAVYVQLGDAPSPRFACTATRIGDRSYLTARHCLLDDAAPPNDGDPPGLLLGSTSSPDTLGCDRERQFVSVLRVAAHPTLDVALLAAEQGQAETEPGGVMRLSDTQPRVAQTAVIAGYGLTEAGTHETLRSLDAQILDVADSEITVQGVGGGACSGDSGGPLYAKEQGTAPTLLGVLSKGSASCLGRDVYVDVSSIGDWVMTTREALD